MIKEGEGDVPCTYEDTEGLLTICYGNLLEVGTQHEANQRRREVANVGGNYDQLMSAKTSGQKQCLSRPQCDQLFEYQLAIARREKNAMFGTSVGCEAADHVLVDLIYNLGTTRLSKFRNMRRAVGQ